MGTMIRLLFCAIAGHFRSGHHSMGYSLCGRCGHQIEWEGDKGYVLIRRRHK